MTHPIETAAQNLSIDLAETIRRNADAINRAYGAGGDLNGVELARFAALALRYALADLMVTHHAVEAEAADAAAVSALLMAGTSDGDIGAGSDAVIASASYRQ